MPRGPATLRRAERTVGGHRAARARVPRVRLSRLVLGINSAHADAAAVLVGEDGVIAAIAEERITRKKHCGGFPRQAVAEVLKLAGATASDVTDLAVARDPRANLRAKLGFLLRHPLASVPRTLDRLRVHRRVSSSATELADALG